MLAELVRRFLSEKNDQFVFRRFEPASDRIRLAERTGLYIHVPFCRSLCPYCPYYKELYEPAKAARYFNALLKEIGHYARYTRNVAWTSLYFGGGTPTLVLNDLFKVKRALESEFGFSGPIGLETTPNDLTERSVDQLERLGVQYLSVGVQSFQDRFLSFIGRDCGVDSIRRALTLVQGRNFSTVNFDLIFVFPGQGIEDVRADLDTALVFGPHQITCYPLFTFPYSRIGERNQLKRLLLPDSKQRKRLYYFIHDYLGRQGYKRTSVWTFNKPGTTPYSSVTRDYYLGLGPGAGTYTGEGFYFNTFLVDEYVRSLQNQDRLPVALKMRVSTRMAKLFWLYWRLYETRIPKDEYSRLFDACFDNDWGKLVSLIRFLGFLEDGDGELLSLNCRGSHWIHLFQNQFALNYVAKIWQVCKREPWPEAVAI